MQIVQPQLEGRRRAFFADLFLGLVLDFLHDLFDACRMNASVRNEALNRLPGHLTAVGIESGEDDGARRVIHDQIDAGRELQRADVAALAADDAALRSSLGRSTTDTVVSMACSAAERWMASVM